MARVILWIDAEIAESLDCCRQASIDEPECREA
jgi:hypothetical protein